MPIKKRAPNSSGVSRRSVGPLINGEVVDRAVAALPPVQLLTPAQAAEMLSVSARTLEYWRGIGDGPAYVRLSRATIRYTAESIAAFVGQRVQTSTAQNGRAD